MAVDPKSPIQTTVVITEGADGSFDVKYEHVVAGTSDHIAMRPAHVVGQLVSAAFFVLLENFETVKAELVKVQRETKSE